MAATIGQIGAGYPGTSGAGGAFGQTLEPGIRGSIPNGGFPLDRVIGLREWMLGSTGAALAVSTGTTPYIAMTGANSNFPVIRFDTAHDPASHPSLLLALTVPGQYDPKVDDFRLLVCARFSGGTVNTVNLRSTLRYFTAGQASPRLAEGVAGAVPPALIDGYTPSLTGDTTITGDASGTNPVSFTVAAERLPKTPIASAALTDFCWYELNLGNNGLKPLDLVAVSLGVDAALASSVTMDIAGTVLRWHNNATLFNRQLRESDVAIFGN